MYWNLLLILCIVSLVCCCIGFKKFVYFLSVGYGFAVAGIGIAILVLAIVNHWSVPLWLVIIQAALFVAYGARLSGFLLAREIKNASYRKVLKEATKEDEKKMPFFLLFFIWIFCGALYVAQCSPVLFRAANQSTDLVCPLIGIGISVIGLILESLADRQKSAQKKERPDMVAMKGLYKLTRCPNYWGEITFWTGVFVAGISTYNCVGQWIMAVVGYICIFYIMVNGAQRLEKRQDARYGENPEYLEYIHKTPILLPFLPIYRLNKDGK